MGVALAQVFLGYACVLGVLLFVVDLIRGTLRDA